MDINLPRNREQLTKQVRQLSTSIDPSKKFVKQWRTKLKKRSWQQKLIRSSLLSVNLLILVVIFIFVLQKPSAQAAGNNLASVSADVVNSTVPSPLDQLASANIALTVAQMDNLPETTPINNTADSQQAELAIASSSDNIIAKPQVTETALKSREDITSYVTQSGDTVASIANKFGVTSDSILWSNNIANGSVIVGQKLAIPPVNGIVYTVKSGDTTSSLATKFKASQGQIVAYNDAEINGIYPGEKIIIPNGVQPNTVAAVTASVNSGWLPTFGSNGYDYGYCTWYVASVISVPSNWGNAATWAFYASRSGWNVSSTPVVGAIAQTPYAAGGEGHVAIVRAVSADGSQIQFSDMNGIAGWGRVGYSGWVSASTFANYISH